ncbi:MAG TPA: hypothetical protein PKH69_08455 [Thiobacillaceae bacterium]|nr:hypothetical protein [Thiobacillaceae bacterium]HNU64599.1 hypothetical protein [Thiobacillaceae bacterium]
MSGDHLLTDAHLKQSGLGWVIIVHWRSIANADVSMKSFASAPAAARFMASIVRTRWS